MNGFLIFLAVLAALVCYGFYLDAKLKRKGKEYNAIAICGSLHMYGVPTLPEKSSAYLFLTPEKLVIESNDKKFELGIEQITGAEYLRKSDLITKDKSVIARGIVGGVLIGPLGAIIGGMSGIGKKKKKGNYLVINYVPSDSEEVKVLILDAGSQKSAQKFVRKIQEKIVSNVDANGVVRL